MKLRCREESSRRAVSALSAATIERRMEWSLVRRIMYWFLARDSSSRRRLTGDWLSLGRWMLEMLRNFGERAGRGLEDGERLGTVGEVE